MTCISTDMCMAHANSYFVFATIYKIRYTSSFFFFFLNRFEEIQDAAVSTAVGNLMNSDQEEIHRVLQCGQRLKGKRWCHPYV